MPKTHGDLWDEIISWDNLHSAYKEAARGKRYRIDVLKFTQNVEENLLNIQNHLMWRSWGPGAWNEFEVYEPKKRLIQAPPFNDRVVHHALVRVVESLFERKFIHDSYACRKGRGVHGAALRLQSFLRRANRKWGGSVYALKADIAAYFPSVRHDRLMDILARTIRDRSVLWLCETIINGCGANGKGIPVGALTSQLFANIYLNELDHFVKDGLGKQFYVRFMDDWVILAPSKTALHEDRAKIEPYLTGHLGLALNPKTQVFPVTRGIDFVGYRTWATHILPRKRNVLRARRRFRMLARAYTAGRVDLPDIAPSVHSFLGYMKHCAGMLTVYHILSGFALRRRRALKFHKSPTTEGGVL